MVVVVQDTEATEVEDQAMATTAVEAMAVEEEEEDMEVVAATMTIITAMEALVVRLCFQYSDPF